MKFYLSVGGFFVGVVVASFTSLGMVFGLFFLLLGIGVGIAGLVHGKGTSVFLVVLVCIGIGLGIVRFEYYDTSLVYTLDSFVGEDISLEGIVTTEPTYTDTRQAFRLQVDDVYVRVSGEVYPRVRYGDVVEVEGMLKHPESFETDGGRVFNYPAYLKKDKITYQLFADTTSVVDAGEGSFLRNILFGTKDTFVRVLNETIPQPHAALMAGLLLGVQDALGNELLDAFRAVGLIHIIVLSGYNITIVADAVMRLFGFVRPRGRFLIGGIVIGLFVVMVGAGATVVRAGLMAGLVLVARILGRRYDMLRALVFVGALMVLYNPYILLFDPSFQLSFLATLSLIVLAPYIERLCIRSWIPDYMRDIVVATLSTQIFVLPLLLFQTGEISVVGLVANALVLGVVPIVMFTGFVTGVLGIVSSILALPFSYVSYALLTYILSITEFMSTVPFATVSLSFFSWWMAWSMYIVYAFVLVYLHTKTKATRI